MRKVLGLVGAMLLFAGPALAADVGNSASSYKAPPLAPVFSWTGWYIGANAGFGWGQSTSPNISSNFINDGGFFPSLSPRGFVGGGQIGYDWQANPNWMVGLVADFQGADIKASGDPTIRFNWGGNCCTITNSLSNTLDFLGTGRMRVGYTSGNWLFYGSGGVAFGDVRSSVGFRSINPNINSDWRFSGSNSETLDGWAAGAGVNYALTRNWIWGVDYLHYDLGRTSATASTPCATGPCSVTASQKVGGDIVRGVINYKF
jgi:outer membrane immunogenic protein